jgi:hypothetical protein
VSLTNILFNERSHTEINKKNYILYGYVYYTIPNRKKSSVVVVIMITLGQSISDCKKAQVGPWMLFYNVVLVTQFMFYF